MGSMNQATPLRGLLQARSDATPLRSVAYYERGRRLGRSLTLPQRSLTFPWMYRSQGNEAHRIIKALGAGISRHSSALQDPDRNSGILHQN